MPNPVQDKHKEDINAQIEKKPYEKPAILYRAPLEALAAVCLPSPPAKSIPTPPNNCSPTFS
jgi:hypothetical protein